jgi:radical SAM superfamily enzyme YgiQ (UPF0313 family)
MNILLIKPPLNKHLLAPNHDEPLEIEYVASAARGHTVEILDMRFDPNLHRTLETFRPDLVGITAFTCDVRAAKDALREVKKFNPRIKTVVGGHHATILPGDFALPFVDTIFLGMADETFGIYANALDGGRDGKETPNIAFVHGDKLHFSEKAPFTVDLDKLPFPARDLTRRYRKLYRDSVRNLTGLIVTSRGCPYRCTFCACWKIMDGKYITRSPESVVEEFAGLPEEIDLICFADDNTLHGTRRAWRLIELIKQRGLKKRFMMYARTDLIAGHPDLMEALRNIGLEYLLVGIESFKDEELKKLNKKVAAETNFEALKVLRNLGISISPHLIVDPEFTRDDFRQLLRYIRDLEIYRPVYTVLTPLPGTQLYDETYERLAIRDYDYFDFTHSVLPTKLSRRDFYRAYSRLYGKSYSFRRYFHWRLGAFVDLFRKKKRFVPLPSDRIPFFRLALLHAFALPKYIGIRNRYKTEPLVSPRTT